MDSNEDEFLDRLEEEIRVSEQYLKIRNEDLRRYKEKAAGLMAVQGVQEDIENLEAYLDGLNRARELYMMVVEE